MEAQVWTLMGILTASQIGQLVALFYLRSRIDALGARLDARIDSYEAFLRDPIDRYDNHMRRHAG